MNEARSRIVITGVGLTAPNGNSLAEFRQNLLDGRGGHRARSKSATWAAAGGRLPLRPAEVPEEKGSPRRHARRQHQRSIAPARRWRTAGVNFERRGRRTASASTSACTEHGNVETENEIYNISKFNYDTKFWSHYHNPRTVANNPAGEVSLQPRRHRSRLHHRRRLRRRQHGPDPRRADAAARRGGLRALRRREREHRTPSGFSPASRARTPSRRTPTRTKASRPFDKARNGIVVSEGGCLYTLERLEDAQARGAKIYGEIAGYHVNSDATDYVLPNPERQAECVRGVDRAAPA